MLAILLYSSSNTNPRNWAKVFRQRRMSFGVAAVLVLRSKDRIVMNICYRVFLYGESWFGAQGADTPKA